MIFDSASGTVVAKKQGNSCGFYRITLGPSGSVFPVKLWNPFVCKAIFFFGFRMIYQVKFC